MTSQVPCPSCGEMTMAGARFCEACGADLSELQTASAAACVACGAHAVEGDYCLQCGHRQPGPRDHMEAQAGRIAGVTDVGRRHHRNEDAMAIADLGHVLVGVVCDGVSTTDNPDAASQAAADTFLGVVAAAVQAGTYERDRTLVEATVAAQDAVLAVERPGTVGNPSCTLVAAVIHDGAPATLDVCWLGDSRAYWLAADGGRLLTIDHSWANDVVAAGELTHEEAMADPRAHTITRWLGADAVDVTPGIVTGQVDQGRVLVCSDGLWNYAPLADDLSIRLAASGTDDLESARRLVAFANESGGHDNITVVIASPHVDSAPAT